jgi:hypothetical protein
MNADADSRRLGYVVDQRAIKAFHPFGHVSRRRERLAAAGLDAAVERYFAETGQRSRPLAATSTSSSPELSSSRVARSQQVSLWRCWRAEQAASSAG